MRRPIWWTAGVILLGLAGGVMVAGAETGVVGAMLWLFCILPLAARPEVFVRPV